MSTSNQSRRITASQNATTGSFAIGGAAGATLGTLGIQGIQGIDTVRIGNHMQINSHVNIGLTKANGGYIVQVTRDDEYRTRPDYYLIHEDAEDFDRELGKIVSLALLKSNT
jgi:hypothetical protein